MHNFNLQNFFTTLDIHLLIEWLDVIYGSSLPPPIPSKRGRLSSMANGPRGGRTERGKFNEPLSNSLTLLGDKMNCTVAVF